VAASIIPRMAMYFMTDFFLKNIIFLRFQDLNFKMAIVMNKTIPLSPIRLYMIAWRADLLASDRVNHHPISINDIIPTPSHPINNMNRFLEETNINMNKRNKIKVLINIFFLGSVFM